MYKDLAQWPTPSKCTEMAKMTLIIANARVRTQDVPPSRRPIAIG